MALGAFLAGVLLASSEYRHALETDIEPFKGLLLGLFFISVGMSIDFGLLLQRPGSVLGLLCGFLLVKTAMLWLVARLLGITTRQRWLFALLLSQGGEFAFRRVRRGSRRRPAVAGVGGGADHGGGAVDGHHALAAVAARPAAWRAARPGRNAPPMPSTTPAEPVIIAGFGRVGQIVGRLLFANGIRAIVLDHDPDQIELLRKFGYKVFYGDATRLDLLTAAGAGEARLLVNAIDDVDDSLALTDLVRANFPQPEDPGAGAQRLALRGTAHARRHRGRARDLRGGAAHRPPRAGVAGRRSLPGARNGRYLSAPQRHDARCPRSAFPRRGAGAVGSPRPVARNWRNCSRATAPGSRRTAASRPGTKVTVAPATLEAPLSCRERGWG